MQVAADATRLIAVARRRAPGPVRTKPAKPPVVWRYPGCYLPTHRLQPEARVDAALVGAQVPVPGADACRAGVRARMRVRGWVDETGERVYA